MILCHQNINVQKCESVAFWLWISHPSAQAPVSPKPQKMWVWHTSVLWHGCRWPKVCESNFLLVNLLSSVLQVGCLPLVWNPNKYKFLSTLALWPVTKMLLEFLAKTVTVHFWYLWISHLSVLEPSKVGFPSLSPRPKKWKSDFPHPYKNSPKIL